MAHDQIYSDKLALFMQELQEKGFGYVVDEYTYEDMQEILIEETNLEAYAQLQRLLPYWSKAREALDIVHQELLENWDEDAWDEKVADAFEEEIIATKLLEAELADEEENHPEVDQPNSPHQKPFMGDDEYKDGSLDDYDDCSKDDK